MRESIVLDRIMGSGDNYCRLVECCNCGRVMIVNHDEEICPECDCTGTLSLTEDGFDMIDYEKATETLADKGYLLCDTE